MVDGRGVRYSGRGAQLPAAPTIAVSASMRNVRSGKLIGKIFIVRAINSVKLRNLLWRPGVQWTSGGWFVTLEESLAQNIGTIRCRQLTAQGINFNNLDTGWRDEIGYRSTGRGAFHEFSPDGKRRLSTGKAQLRLVVESHPNNSQQIGVYPTNQASL